jgi:hypothetical protein
MHCCCLRTGDVNNDLEAHRSASTGQVVLTDTQGNRVSVLGKQPTLYGSVVFWDVSSVLMSGEGLLWGWWGPHSGTLQASHF